MLETAPLKKNKFSLSDYDYQQDIAHRLEIASFSKTDFAVLEEILFSPLKTSTRKVSNALSISEKELASPLDKLMKMGLLSLDGDLISIDKTMRRYFETEVEKFDPDFKPGMEFLQNLLKKVPIHILPVWYALPRTSNNIFDSIVEKYLLTPQTFQRHLVELNFATPTTAALAHDVFRSPDLTVTAKAAKEKYHITEEELEESLLLLEFHFVCCASYRQQGEEWEKIITPFHEWKEYLTFLNQTASTSSLNLAKVERTRSHDFAFVEDMALLLQNKGAFDADYTAQLTRKLQLLQLLDGKKPTEAASHWLEMRLENRALYLYRHPLNKITSAQLPSDLLTEKTIRDAEKAILRVLHSGWVLFEDFIKGVTTSLGDHPPVTLKESGKRWRYLIPTYSSQELSLLHAVVFEGLFEAGVTATGIHEGRECFCVTPFGQSLFS
jgi:hypothetical protein